MPNYSSSLKPSKLSERDILRVSYEVVIYNAFCLSLAESRMNGAPNETQTHLWRFASLVCLTLHHLTFSQCWGSEHEFINDVVLWTSKHWKARAGWTKRAYINQLCVNTRCSQEPFPEWMKRERGGRESQKKISISSQHDNVWLVNYIDLKLLTIHVIFKKTTIYVFTEPLQRRQNLTHG